MKTGTSFVIGDTHKVCEDYALHTEDSVFLSDGCSNGYGPPIDSDWGARIMCQFGRIYLPLLKAHGPKLYEGAVVRHALSIAEAVDKSESCLTASLVTAYKQDNFIKVMMIGDGLIGVKLKNGKYKFCTFDYNMNAPYYPIYGKSEESKQDFFSRYSSIITMNSWEMESFDADNPPEAVVTKWDYAEDPWITRAFRIKEIEFVFVGTDGFESFTRQVKTQTSKYTEEVSVPEVVWEMTQFPHFGNDFVGSQCKWMLRMNRPNSLLRKGWTHRDDFSMGVIYCGDK